MYVPTIRQGLARPSLLFTTMESVANTSSSSISSLSSTNSIILPPIHRIHLLSVDSTNTYAKQNVSTFPPHSLTVITTDEQTAGRGRLGRIWKSSTKNQDITMTFTFPLPKLSISSAYQLSPLLSIAAVRALAKVQVSATIKWPNDIIISNCKKIGGILCELESVPILSFTSSTSSTSTSFFTSESYSGMWAALGIGLNINSEPEVLNISRPVWPLTTLYAESNKQIIYDIDFITNTLIEELQCMLPIFLEKGFEPFHNEYEKYSILLGKLIQFRIEDNSIVKGKVHSIGTDGKLYIKVYSTNNSESSSIPQIQGYLSGEVSGIELIPGENMIEGSEH